MCPIMLVDRKCKTAWDAETRLKCQRCCGVAHRKLESPTRYAELEETDSSGQRSTVKPIYAYIYVYIKLKEISRKKVKLFSLFIFFYTKVYEYLFTLIH